MTFFILSPRLCSINSSTSNPPLPYLRKMSIKSGGVAHGLFFAPLFESVASDVFEIPINLGSKLVTGHRLGLCQHVFENLLRR